MKFCADTWYILKLFGRDEKALEIIKNVKFGKDELIIPIIVVSESFKKLFQQGISEYMIDSFFNALEASEKISIIPFDKEISKEAAKLSVSKNIPLTDSLIVATGKLSECDFILSNDSHFKVLQKTKYIKLKFW